MKEQKWSVLLLWLSWNRKIYDNNALNFYRNCLRLIRLSKSEAILRRFVDQEIKKLTLRIEKTGKRIAEICQAKGVDPKANDLFF